MNLAVFKLFPGLFLLAKQNKTKGIKRLTKIIDNRLSYFCVWNKNTHMHSQMQMNIILSASILS